jgi:hypothetical protein
MGGGWKARWEMVWKWADRIGIADTLIKVFGLKTVFGLLGSGTMAIWSYLAGMPGPVIGTLALTAFVGLIWACNGVMWLKSQQGQTRAMGSRSKRAIPQTEQDPNAWRFFVGRWRAWRDRTGTPFFIDLCKDWTAKRSSEGNLAETLGTWEFVNGEAVVHWKDGWTAILRCTPEGRIIKLAFKNKFDAHKPHNLTEVVKEP